jgi:hypothetical protein
VPRWSERKMAPDRTMKSSSRRLLAGVVLGAGVCGLFAACSTVPYPPTYTQAELRAICERRGGWWRGNLIPDYCEYQAASLIEAP